MQRYEKTLYEEALALSIDKCLADVTTLLQWAQTQGHLSEKIVNVEQAIVLLNQVKENYEQMRETL